MTRKILMLHGLAQSGEYFYSKTKGFRTELEKLGYTFYYATAPNKYPAADLPDYTTDITTDSNEVLAWLENDTINKSYSLPQTTLDYLHDICINEGPFEGIVGFSQGAGLAGYLATDFNGLLNLTSEQQPKLIFIIFVSGFRFKPEKYQQQYNDHPITIPSLHVQGELDTVSEPEKVQALLGCCEDGTKTHLMHSGGHFVPNSRGFLKKVITWLKTVDPTL